MADTIRIVEDWINSAANSNNWTLRMTKEQYLNLRRLVLDAPLEPENANFWTQLRSKCLQRLGPVDESGTNRVEDVAFVLTLLVLHQGCLKTFADSSLGMMDHHPNNPIITIKDVKIIIRQIGKIAYPLPEFSHEDLFRTCETQCYTQSGVGFCNIGWVNVVDDTHGTVLLYEPPWNKYTEDYVKIVLFSDLEHRIYSCDPFPAGMSNADCLKNSSFFKSYLATPQHHLGSFKCRCCEDDEHYTVGTILCDSVFHEVTHPCIRSSAALQRGDDNQVYVLPKDTPNDLDVILANLRFSQDGLPERLKNRFQILFTCGTLRYSQATDAIGACVKLHNGYKRHFFDNVPTNCESPECECKLAEPTTLYRDRTSTEPARLLMDSYTSCTPYTGPAFSRKMVWTFGKKKRGILLPLPDTRLRDRGPDYNDESDEDDNEDDY